MVRTLCLSLQGAQVRSLVGELRSHLPHSVAKKKKKGTYPCKLCRIFCVLCCPVTSVVLCFHISIYYPAFFSHQTLSLTIFPRLLSVYLVPCGCALPSAPATLRSSICRFEHSVGPQLSVPQTTTNRKPHPFLSL